MPVDRGKLYDEATDFFSPTGNVIMQLTSQTAIDVCLQSAKRGFVVLGIEGGIHKAGSFSPRSDCIWDGSSTVKELIDVIENNKDAADFIRNIKCQYNAFLITVAWISRKQKKF